MDFLQLAQERYSVRKFKDTAVEPEKLQKILEAGRIAPTACNLQPQRVITVSSPDGLAKLDEATRMRYGAPLALLVCFDSDAAWTRKFDGQTSGWVDASIVTTQMMLEATDLGLGTLWAMHFKPEVLSANFDLPANVVPVAILMVGYAADDAEPAPMHADNLPVEKTVFTEAL